MFKFTSFVARPIARARQGARPAIPLYQVSGWKAQPPGPEFQSVLAFRQQHRQPGAFGRSDLYVLCRLRPMTFDLTPCSQEIGQCRWMTLEELRAQMRNVSSLTLRLTDLIQRGLDQGFEDVDIVQEGHRSLYRGLTFNMFFRPLGGQQGADRE
ncbi:hypothetical protein ACOMHN_048957 [Nucella lapillus]